MGFEWSEDNKTGANCSGTDGTANRTLTVDNTKLTKQGGFLVVASGLTLALTTEYTVVHATSGTVITFLNRMYDDMTIVVKYLQVLVTTNNFGKARNDFQAIVIENGIGATITRQTDTTASMGEITAVSGADYSIFVSIQGITQKDRQIHEMGLAVPGNAKAFFFHEYPDSITNNGTLVVKVGDILTDDDTKKWRVEKIIAERFLDAQEIFKSAVIKRIDLDEK